MTQVPSDKLERPRPSREERDTPAGIVLPWEQSRFFSQLFIGEDEGKGLKHPPRASMKPTDSTTVDAFAEQLTVRLNTASQWPMQASFFLPRLGRVDISARREQGVLHVELDAEEERTRLWLGSARQRCQDRLSADLRQPIHLSVTASGCS